MRKKILLISLSIVVILALVTPGCIPKKAEPAQNPTDTERIAALEKTVGELKGKVASLPVPEDYGDEIAELTTQQTAQEEEIAGLKERVEELEDQNSEQEEETSGDVDPEDAVGVDIRYQSVITLTTPLAGRTGAGTEADPYVFSSAILTTPIRLKLENTLSVPIEDVILSARITLKPGGFGQQFSIDDTDLTGDIDWYEYSLNYFESWEDIKLKELTRDSFALTYSAQITNTGEVAIPSVKITLRIICEEYEVAR